MKRVMRLVGSVARSLVLASAMMGVAACASATPDARVPSLTRVGSPDATKALAALPTETRAAITIPSVPLAPTPNTAGVTTVVLWTTEEFAPGPSPAGKIFKEHLDAFLAANPNIQIEIVFKKPYGKGGLLDFLLTTNAVIPARVPDLIVLDLAETAQAAAVLQPLDAWMPADWRDDLFSFARHAAHVNGRWLIAPLAMDMPQLVYDKTLMAKPPQTWDEVLRQKQLFLTPIGSDDAFLLQYHALAPMDSSQTPVQFEVSATATVLEFFRRAHDQGVIPDLALGLKSVEETWLPFAQGQVAMAHVSASRYLTERGQTPNAGYAPVPTRDGRGAPLATGWGLALTARDPARQPLAARVMRWLTQSDRLAMWLRAARRLPAQRAPLAMAIEPLDYARFVREQLERATFMPTASAYAKSAEVWRVAIPAVWKGQITAEEAARNIVAAGK